MDKKQLSERDICTKYITPAIDEAGWDVKKQVREEYFFTDGRVIVRQNLTARGKRKRADYILFYKPNMPLAVIEAKDNRKTVGAGLQQGIGYAEALQVPFVYSSNGDGFIEYDRLTGVQRELGLDEFPSPEELWGRMKYQKQWSTEQEALITEPYYYKQDGKMPRYYQMNAINRTVEAIAKGQDRILLVMATGTGKTYTAFQIIWRLWKAKKKKKILFLADRNILVDQTMQNDFMPFQGMMTKIEKGVMDSSFEVYLSLYHQLSNGQVDEEVFKQFSPDFFDLIVIDECHRGSAKDNSRWRKILDYFGAATHIGLTATPKETEAVSNAHYFGEPVYTYTLKEGIGDGFLAPYKVIRIAIDRDVEGYRPTKGKRDRYDELVDDKEYFSSDFDRTIVIDDRTKIVAKKVSEYLKNTDRFSKTIVFCVDTEHAERMRQALINENQDLMLQDSRYIMQITGDNKEGKAQLSNFIDDESPYPTVVTTSKLLSTGVDCKMVKLIVLDSNIQSPNEFKQIIGRGTRLKPELGKEYFTIMDFRNVSHHFADPNFDGFPIQVYVPEEDDPLVPPPADDESGGWEDAGEVEPGSEEYHFNGKERSGRRRKFYLDDVNVKIINERIQYYDERGQLVTESLRDYTKNNIKEEFATLDDFIRTWSSEEQKDVIIENLFEHGVILEALRQEVGQEYDEFDLICHIAYDQKPLSRSERVKKVKTQTYFEEYGDIARAVIDSMMEKYQNEGRFEFPDVKILELNPFQQYGNPMAIAKAFGGKKKYEILMKRIQGDLYA